MGSGSYSVNASTSADGSKVYLRNDAAAHKFYFSAPATEIFKQKSINNAMNPHGIVVRESRDSVEHPKSLAIIVALDVTGSMGTVPHHLIKEGLPNIMGSIIERGIKDPQVLFLGIGDHECDSSPLQVSQFESSDKLLDKWLEDVYLEGGGGGNEGESYLLAWYLAAKHTSIDCFEKRNQKGFLFTIGDEPVLKQVPQQRLHDLMGDGQYTTYTSLQLLEEARKMYNVFHIHIKETNTGSRKETVAGWKQLMGDNLIVAESYKDVSRIISEIVNKDVSLNETTRTEILLS